MTKLSALREKYLSLNALAAWEYHDLRVTYARKHVLSKAQNGDRRAALFLIEICSEAIGDGVALDPAVATWLAKILADMAGGATLEEAANIPKRRLGEKKERDAAKAHGRRISMAYQFGVRYKHEGMKKIAAIAEVADLFHVERDTVISAWKAHQAHVERFIALQLQTLGKVMKITSPPKPIARE